MNISIGGKLSSFNVPVCCCLSPISHAVRACKTLGQALEVNRSTIMRDLVFLKDRLEVDFEWDAEDQCYILKGDCKHIPCMGLSDVDKLLLNYIGQILAELGPTELGCAMQESYKKLSSLFTGKNPKAGWGIQADFSKVATQSVTQISTRRFSGSRTLSPVCTASSFSERPANVMATAGTPRSANASATRLARRSDRPWLY